jgi:putative membrane protein
MIEKVVSSIVLLIFFEFAAFLLTLVLLGDTSISSLLGVSISAGIVLWIIVIFLYSWYVKAYIRRYYYDAGPDFVTIKKGVFAPAEIHVQYQKIQDVYVDQDILDRIMGLYDVHIASATAASAIEAHIDGVEKAAAEGLKDLLLAKLKNPSSSMPQNAAPSSSPAQGPVAFSEEISTATYPIEGKWVIQQIISSIVISFFLTDFLFIYVALPGKNSDTSLLTMLGFSASGMFEAWFIIFVVVTILLVVYGLMWRSTYSFSFLPEYIVMKQGVISRKETHLPYRSVQDISVAQGIVERMLGLATVKIENAAAPMMVGRRVVSSALSIPGQSLARANHLSDVAKATILKFNPTQTGL